ncbi:MAG: OmpA family protein [Saprospiraceae bacterium]
MQLGTDVQYTFTDNLDNVSGPFARFPEASQNAANNPGNFGLGENRGEPGNDWYAFTYIGARFYFGNRAEEFRSPVVVLGELPLGDTMTAQKRLFAFSPPEPLTPLEITPLPVSNIPAALVTVAPVSVLPPAPQWEDTDGDADVPSIEDEGLIVESYVGDDSYAREEIYGESIDTSVVKTTRPAQIVSTYPEWAKDENYKINDSLSKSIQNMDINFGTKTTTSMTSTARLDSLSEAASAKTRQIDSFRAALTAMKLVPAKADSVVVRGSDTVFVERIVTAPINAEAQEATRRLEAELVRLNQEAKDTEAYRKRLIEQDENRFKLLEARDRQIAKEAKRDDQTQRKFDRGLLKNDEAETRAMQQLLREQATLRSQVTQLSAQMAAMSLEMKANQDTSATVAPVQRVVAPAQPVVETPRVITQAPTADPVLDSELSALRKEMTALRKSMVPQPVTPAPAPVVIAPVVSAPAPLPVPKAIDAEILTVLSQYGSAQVFFATGKSAVTSEGMNSLAGLANGARQYPERILVNLTGFTDKTGSQAANQTLSQRRVDAVRSALLSMGVNPTQIRSNANGPDLNAGDLASARRVEVSLRVR